MKFNLLDINHKFSRILAAAMLLLISSTLFAHAAVIDLEKMPKGDAALLYLNLGYQHILPLGIDHIFFVLCLLLLNPKLKPILMQATAFTVAHTITLGLSMYHIISPPAHIVEPLIALSIMYVAMENIISPRLKNVRIGIVFLFGLVHGMGFASALGELGLPQNSYLLSLLMFNLGVELGQLTVILTAYFLVVKWFGDKLYYRKLVVVPASLMIFIVAGFWTVQRLFMH